MILAVRRVLGASAVLCLIVLSVSLLLMYHEVQNRLSFEGRNLHSLEARVVDIEPGQVAQLVERLGGDARAFVDLSSSGRVRAFVAADDAPDALARVSGGETMAGDGDAWVGRQVTTVRTAGSESFEFEGKTYVVGGRLGADGQSLLAHSAVIADRDLFGAFGIDGTVVVDGSNVVERIAQVSPDLTSAPVPRGATERTNIDAVSPVFLTLGLLAAVLGALLVGGILGAQVFPWMEISFLLGKQPARILAVSYSAPLTCLLIGYGAVIATALLAGLGRMGTMSVAYLGVGVCTLAAFTVAVRANLPWSR